MSPRSGAVVVLLCGLGGSGGVRGRRFTISPKSPQLVLVFGYLVFDFSNGISGGALMVRLCVVGVGVCG